MIEVFSWAALSLSIIALSLNVYTTAKDPNRKKQAYADIRWGIRKALIEHRGGWSAQSWRPRRLERYAYARTKRNLE